VVETIERFLATVSERHLAWRATESDRLGSARQISSGGDPWT
jgi:hypothetical protein